MIIHLVRHGQTQIGDDGLYLPNAGLTELGRRQADQVAGRLAKLNPQASVSSNLPRAVETAESFSRISGHAVHQIAGLAELDTGDIWMASDSVKARIRNGDYLVDFRSLGGETLVDFNARIRTGFAQLLDLGTALHVDSIAVFLHEGVIGTIIDHLEGRVAFEPGRRESMPNGAMITIDSDGNGPHYPGFWETGHLDAVSG